MTVWTRPFILRRASAADIAAIMEIERQPGYEHLVGRWDEAQHLRNLSKPGYLYLVHDDAQQRPAAFAALSGLGGADGEVWLNRLIVRNPGQGTGRITLQAAMKLAFEGAPTLQLCLRVRPENQRARHLYESEGFAEQRLLQKAGTTPGGERVDLLLMSIGWEAWEARNPD